MLCAYKLYKIIMNDCSIKQDKHHQYARINDLIIIDNKKMGSTSESWMTNLPDTLKGLPITELAIPGSHDSGTYAITENSDFAPDMEDILKDLEFLGPLLKEVMFKWSKTQEATVAQQLNFGLRYFDLRVSTKENDPNFHFVHGLYGAEAGQFLNEVNSFLDDHNKEVVILDFNHFYDFDSESHEQLLNFVTSIFGNKMLPVSALTGVSLDFMTNKNQFQVIVVYRNGAAAVKSLFWPDESFPTPWADTTNVDGLIEFLDDGIENRNSNICFISQCILTPDASFIVENLLSNLKDKCFLPLEQRRSEWLSNQKAGNGGVNIVISDFTEYSNGDFAKNVIALNAKLLI